MQTCAIIHIHISRMHIIRLDAVHKSIVSTGIVKHLDVAIEYSHPMEHLFGVFRDFTFTPEICFGTQNSAGLEQRIRAHLGRVLLRSESFLLTKDEPQAQNGANAQRPKSR